MKKRPTSATKATAARGREAAKRKPAARASAREPRAKYKTEAAPSPPAPAAGATVAVKPAKGRPMLTWVGKRPLRHVTAFPAQLVERFSASGSPSPLLKAEERGPGGEALLFHGDNKEVLAHLLANGYRGKVNLIYIDPPFDSGADYVRKVQLRGLAGTAKLDGDTYTLGEQIQYTDIWANDNYLQFMYERLLLLKELLDSERGFISLQCDWRKSHHLRSLLDEVLGADNFRGEILIRAGTKNVQSQFEEVSALTIGNNSIFLYSRSSDAKLPKLVETFDKIEPGKWDTFWRGTDRPTMRYELFGQTPRDGQWRWRQERALQADRSYHVYLDHFANKMSLDEYYLDLLKTDAIELDFVRLDRSGTVQYFVPPRNYKLLSNVWFDLSFRGTKTDYPTEKHEEPLARLMDWLTRTGDLVLDCFVGSGTTAAVAQKLGRRWIGCDINKGAIQTTIKRLMEVMREQAEQPAELPGMENGAAPSPAQLSFAVHRVNDYDLQIQHNEAVNLACDFLGIARTHTDPFFDGTLGKRLAKIAPFNHPVTPLDLEEVRRELSARPEESRDIALVGLGKEVAVDAWLEDWNRMRKAGSAPNKIEVIELRSDPKYGGFFQHQPASARVAFKRTKGKIKVTIQDFISPTILERLKQQSGILAPHIADWRSMVDSAMIDSAYNGKAFNVALADVPERKDDLVQGEYELDAPDAQTTVAVKITDMLGEEVLVTKQL